MLHMGHNFEGARALQHNYPDDWSIGLAGSPRTSGKIKRSANAAALVAFCDEVREA